MWSLQQTFARQKSGAKTMKWGSNGSPRAFTLIECLVALGVLALAVVLMTPIMRTSQILTEKISNYGDQELEVALIQLEYELEGLHFSEVHSDCLVFVNEQGAKAEFKLAKETFIKRLNNGYHPLLTKVQKVAVQKAGPSVLLTFTFLDGRVRCGKVQISEA